MSKHDAGNFFFNMHSNCFSGTLLYQGGKKMKTRFTWAEVLCGKVSGCLRYYADQLVEKGENVIVEVTRQDLSDLAQLLADVNQVRPKRGVLCYGNGGGGKGKIVFCYAATLVESRLFEDVFMHFLFVGHTHNLQKFCF